MLTTGSQLRAVEDAIARALATGDREGAANLTIRHYGPEILGFLVVQLRSDQHADDVFSMFAEDLWRGLGALRLQSTMRAYAYALARNASHRFLARDLRRQHAALPLSVAERLAELVAQTRTKTATWIATDSKQRLAQLRERLTSDEQALLTLRLDRNLEWAEIAEIFGEVNDSKRPAARYRKRFQLLKDKLTVWMREAGLVSSSE